MVEHRTVAPDVAGSIPVTHPKSPIEGRVRVVLVCLEAGELPNYPLRIHGRLRADKSSVRVDEAPPFPLLPALHTNS